MNRQLQRKFRAISEDLEAHSHIINSGGCGVVADMYYQYLTAIGEKPTIYSVAPNYSTLKAFSNGALYDFHHFVVGVDNTIVDAEGVHKLSSYLPLDEKSKKLRPRHVCYRSVTSHDTLQEVLKRDYWNPRFVMSRWNQGKLINTIAKRLNVLPVTTYCEESELVICKTLTINKI